MSESDETKPEDGPRLPLDRQTIRESVVARILQQRQEAAAEEKAQRRRARDERVRERRNADLRTTREKKARRLKALNEANGRVRDNVAAAARSLRAALHAATEIPVRRHTAEGRAQQQTVRRLQGALSSLGNMRIDSFDATSVEVDLDID